ncbi:hypothetical protein BWD12_11465 [Leptospira santarosai serovar Bananal]|uniref:Uncharacterized protein n=1 Tax=Leptospira santarosai TaxID=28183 RepID=A0AB73N7S3_9LEPT|nr:hypothetical protein BV917_07415 [Leptospira santarosai serovar Guaricura]OLY63549.1 hypothetical protein BWD11_14130 [Leptospira santarosai serovar Grippotyphosa]ONF78568.1 hypothetical protein BWD12_11465 [Leptospira santarosai serovar Bananal]ONF84961.1 hypothetical protein BWD13_15215 [Leptospira santarosai serovar Grippotyphosa]ONF92267.1 hypothetical protein BWD14_13655 [Leptospira santarosai]
MTTALLPFKSIIILSYLNFLQLKYFARTPGQGSFPDFKLSEQNERSALLLNRLFIGSTFSLEYITEPFLCGEG